MAGGRRARVAQRCSRAAAMGKAGKEQARRGAGAARAGVAGGRGKRWVAGGMVLAVVLLVAGCGGGTQPGAGSTPAGTPEVGFNGTDIAWVQLMIPMNEQVLPLLEHAAGSAKTLAGTVRNGHLKELTQLKDLRKRAGLGEENPHAGHVMPGLVTQDDMAHADDQAKLISKVIEHLEQRVLLATGARSSGTHKGVKSLATAIEQASIDALTSWRALSMEWVPSVHPSKEI